jgi:hypothetical protein
MNCKIHAIGHNTHKKGAAQTHPIPVIMKLSSLLKLDKRVEFIHS